MNVVPPPPPTPGAYSHTTPAGVIVTSKTMHLGGDTAGRGGVRTIKGERGPDGTTVVEITGVLRTPIRPRSSAPNYNLEGVRASDLQPEHPDVATYEVAHLWGPGFGDEARDGMMLAPEAVNQALQNRGIEDKLRELQAMAGANGTVLVTARATSHPTMTTEPRGHELLASVSYSFHIQQNGNPAPPPQHVGQIDITVPAPPVTNPDVQIKREGWIGSAQLYSS
jgi:putative RNase toxin 4 of polymorphic toxin system